jgi:hypothetical protein
MMARPDRRYPHDADRFMMMQAITVERCGNERRMYCQG